MDLRNLDESSLQKIVLFAERLVELQNANGQINFDDPDIENAEKQAMEYIERRKAGHRNSEILEDADIRTGVREFLKKRAIYRNELEKETRDVSTTYPEF